MTSTTHKPDGAAVLAAALFDLSERAMRDAARLAVIAGGVTRNNLPYAHFALANYIARREGTAYGRDEAIEARNSIEAMCPDLGKKAERHRKLKAKQAEAKDDRPRKHGVYQGALIAGMEHFEAIRLAYNTEPEEIEKKVEAIRDKEMAEQLAGNVHRAVRKVLAPPPPVVRCDAGSNLVFIHRAADQSGGDGAA